MIKMELWKKILVVIAILAFEVLFIGSVVYFVVMMVYSLDTAVFEVHNSAGEDVWVSAYGLDGPFYEVILAPLIFPLPVKTEAFLPENRSTYFAFDYDVERLDHFIVKNRNGEVCYLEYNTNPSCCWYSVSRFSKIYIAPLNSSRCIEQK